MSASNTQFTRTEIMAEEDLLADEQGRDPKDAALDCGSRVVDEFLLDWIALRDGKQTFGIVAGRLDGAGQDFSCIAFATNDGSALRVPVLASCRRAAYFAQPTRVNRDR